MPYQIRYPFSPICQSTTYEKTKTECGDNHANDTRPYVRRASDRGRQYARGSEFKRLIARREKLLADLVRLERDQRDDPRYRTRREEIVAALENVYSGLDIDGVTPGPGTAGVPA